MHFTASRALPAARLLACLKANALAVSIHGGHRLPPPRPGRPSFLSRPTSVPESALAARVELDREAILETQALVTLGGATARAALRDLTRLEKRLARRLQALDAVRAPSPPAPGAQGGPFVLNIPECRVAYARRAPILIPAQRRLVNLSPEDWEALRDWRLNGPDPRSVTHAIWLLRPNEATLLVAPQQARAFARVLRAASLEAL